MLDWIKNKLGLVAETTDMEEDIQVARYVGYSDNVSPHIKLIGGTFLANPKRFKFIKSNEIESFIKTLLVKDLYTNGKFTINYIYELLDDSEGGLSWYSYIDSILYNDNEIKVTLDDNKYISDNLKPLLTARLEKIGVWKLKRENSYRQNVNTLNELTQIYGESK